MVVEDIPGVANDEPLPKLLPPDEDANQFMLPALALAPNVTVPESQRLADVVPVMPGIGFIEAVTAVLVGLVQPFKVAST